MVDTKSPGDKTLSVPTKTLTLKPRVETGTVRQSFSHGRTKQVVVEKRGKRRVGGDAPATETHAPEPVVAKAAPVAKAPLSRPASPAAPRGGSGVVLRTLTEDERSARASALADAKVREVEERRLAEEEAKRRASREGIEQAEREAAEARRKAEEERHRVEEEAKRKAEVEAKKRFGEAEAKTATATTRPLQRGPARGRPPGAPAARPAAAAPPARAPGVAADASDEDEGPRQIRRGPGGAMRPVVPPKTTHKPAPQKERGRLTLVTALNADDVRERSIASFRRRTQRLKGHASNEPKEKLIREVTIPEAITIQELANRMSERAVDVIRLLMKQGAMHKITDVIDADTAQLIAEEMGHTVKRVAASDVEEGLFDVVDDSTDTEPRSPVVTVMGHVDHGKTSLLDALRHANVVSGEAGGITQHIGAYQVTSPESGKKITFIDTPGHAAFTAMRARGAKVTDIVILVVAADDGVMPQTIEAINHAKAAKVPMIVAINKIDKPDAKPERVRTELLQHEVQVELLGGDVVDVEVSAKNKTNLDKLLEMIALQAELLDLKTNAERPAEGTVIEAKLDRGRGPVATVLVQRGTLRVGDIIVAGAEMGRVRALISDQGETIDEAGPSVPVEVLGFNGPPEAGDRLAVVENEARARQVTSYRAHQKRENAAASISGMRGSLEQMMSQLKTVGPQGIPADHQGRRAGLARSDSRFAGKARHRRSRSPHPACRRRRHLRIRRHAGGRLQRRDHRLLGARQQGSRGRRQAQRHRDPLLQHHLRSRRRHQKGDVRPARADAARNHAGQCADPGSVQHFQGRQGRRLPRHRRHRGTRRQCAPDPRQRRRARRQALDAEALQGRSEGSAVRPGMRHGVRELRRHASRRRDRVLSRGDHPALSVSPNLARAWILN